jgi:hypothetical protein
MATTGACYSFKQEILQAIHNFDASATFTGNTTNTSVTITNISSMANAIVGKPISGTGIPTGTVIATIASSNSITISQAATATNSGVTFTVAGDVFYLSLVRTSPSLTYGPTQTNIGTPGTGSPSTSNLGTDEVSGTGYTAGGIALGNVTPSLPGSPTGTATTQFTPNPSWTSATFSTTAGIIYNSSDRCYPSGRTIAVFDFGGTQTVTAGTFTLVMPSNTGSAALLRLS